MSAPLPSLGPVPAETPSPGGRPWGQPSHEIQRLWFELLRSPWRTLAVVPLGGPALALEVANALAEVGGIHAHRAVVVVDGTRLELRQVATILGEISEAGGADRVLVALAPLSASLVGVPIARACDAALLCVELGRDRLEDGKQALELIGPQKVVGAAVFHGEGGAR